MGCDIHPVVEVKIKGRWEKYCELEVGRDYVLFGKLAGVRDLSVNPISWPKGFPHNLSGLTSLYFNIDDSDNNGFHDASYLTRTELSKLYRWLVLIHGRSWYEFDEMDRLSIENLSEEFRYAARALCLMMYSDQLVYDEVWKYLLEKSITDIRLVFAFDS